MRLDCNKLPNIVKVTTSQASLLSAVYLRGGASAEHLAKITRMKTHSVRYLLKSLTEKGILLDRTPLIEYRCFGFDDYSFFLGGKADSTLSSSELTSNLVSVSGVSYIAELGGEYQMLVSLMARSAVDASNLLDALSAKSRNLIRNIDLSIRVGFHILGRRYLAPKLRQEPVSIVSRHPGTVDDIDKRILEDLARYGLQSVEQIGKRLSISGATVFRRLQNMQKTKVIAAYLYRQDLRALGIQSYRLLLETRARTQELTKRLWNFANSELNCTHFIECLGRTNYEIVAEVQKTDDIMLLRDKIYRTLGDDLVRLRLLQNFRSLHYRPMPI